MKKVNPLKYFNDQADKRKKALSKAALGMDMSGPPPGSAEYYAAGDSTNIKNALVNKLNLRNDLEKKAGYFTNTEQDLKKAIEDRDNYVKGKQDYMISHNLTPREMGQFSKPLPVPQEKAFKRKRR